MILLLGFGEVGQTLGQGLGAGFSAWDVEFANPASAQSKAITQLGVGVPISLAQAGVGADIIVCAVTAAQDETAACDVAKVLRPGAYFMDVNSASPNRKARAAALIEEAGGRYVEAVIMSPIRARGLASPILLGGQYAREFGVVALKAGFSGAVFYSECLGLASATKLCRSVLVKGLEALLTESMLAARHYGVEQAVLDSMRDFFPEQKWETLADYMIRRGLQHGTRRAEEMREAAEMVRDAGVEPLMSLAIAERHNLSATHKNALMQETFVAMLDSIRTDNP